MSPPFPHHLLSFFHPTRHMQRMEQWPHPQKTLPAGQGGVPRLPPSLGPTGPGLCAGNIHLGKPGLGCLMEP